ncbi:MAG: hypothetical protein ACREO7_14610, partial [Pseudoxanthomonas sp.]
MATAGSIIIDLQLNTAGFFTDTARSEKRLKDLQKTAKQAGVAMGAAFVAAGTGLALLVNRSIDAADETSKMAQKIGIGTE